MEFKVVVVSFHAPGRISVPFGVLLLDGSDRLYFRFRSDLDAEPDDIEVLRGVPEMINSMAMEMGAQGLLEWLEDTASNAIRVGDPVTVMADNAIDAVDAAFQQYVLVAQG